MPSYWTNESVLALAGDRDPVTAIEDAARRLVLEAVESGWEGPPFDPFDLARILAIPVIAKQELRDARTVPVGGRRVAIEYNPTRPPGRLRFSLAHEIAHTLFPDVARAARYRDNPDSGPRDAWQLELLCNIAAGEILMPTASLSELRDGPLEIERLMTLRRKYDVSTEALLRRTTKLTGRPVAMFAAARADPLAANSPFRVDYLTPSRAWDVRLRAGHRRPHDSVLADCTAVGFTAKARETWSARLREVDVQAVGAPPYPGHRYPRVLGLIRPRGVRAAAELDLTTVHGDATAPRGRRPVVIAHLVNDKTPNWGGGFARALRDRFPAAQEDFRAWVLADRRRLQLGAVRIVTVDPGVEVATIVAQRGYGRSRAPRLRYEALRAGLASVSTHAQKAGASVHMPRLGAGQAGGRWPVIRELVEAALTRQGVPATVYVPTDQDIADEPSELTLGI